MPYTIKVIKNKGYLNITHTGKIGIIEMEKARTDAFYHLIENNISRILVDITQIKKAPSLFTRFHFFIKHNSKLPKDYKTALLVNHNSNITQSIVDKLRNKINIKINQKIFTSKQEALNWLLI